MFSSLLTVGSFRNSSFRRISSQFKMEAGEETGGNANLKRQREPLSDSEDNIVIATEIKDGLKRRRLEATGQENCIPKPSSSGHLVELQTKPDTPMIPSVRSRLQLLTQRRDVPRCLSDPGADSPSVINKDIKEHLLGEEEFNQRLERFKAPVFVASPAPAESPASPCPRTRSDFVSGIQQKLQYTTTPSSKQASSIRQERERELNQLPFQPISENAWLKRSSSDSSLTHQGPDSAEMKDGSITETLKSGAEKPLNMTGEGTSSQVPAASAELKLSNESDGEKDGDVREHKTTVVNKEGRPGSQHAEAQTVVKLFFNADHSLSELQTADEHNFLQSTLLDESHMKETSEISRVTEETRSEVFAFNEDGTMEGSSYNEYDIEPSTDEELRIWRYPQDEVFRDEESVTPEENQLIKEEEGQSETSTEDKDEGCCSTRHTKPADVQNVKCGSADVSSETPGSPEQQNNRKERSEEEKLEIRSNVEDSVKEKSNFDGQEKMEPYESCYVEMLIQNEDDAFQQSKESQAVSLKHEALKETQSGNADHENNAVDSAQSSAKTATDGNDEAQSSTEIQASDSHEMEMDSAIVADRLTTETQKTESSKRVTFILDPELINSSALTESDTSMETSLSDAELSSHDETNTSEIIDKMFEEVLDCAESVEEKGQLDEDMEERDSGIGACSAGKDKMDADVDEKSEKEEEAKEEECDEDGKLDSFGDELLTFPPSGILSPLSKSVEAVVTPMRLAAAQESLSSSLLLTPEESSTAPAESAPLYSIDAYRTQRQSKLQTIKSVTPAVQRRTPEATKPQPLINTKEKIVALNEEAVKLQTVINQTLQALSCCTDEEHGRGSLEEAEAEKLLLVSCEKRSALLAEVARLREERSSESEAASKDDTQYVSLQPCRGTISITNIQLPLKVEFVCSSQNRTGRPSHYFFVLIRYGPCHIVATPLATAANARNGDAISFPTSVTLKDIRSSFEIDVEVYSLSHSSGTNSNVDRTSTKSRVTPRKLLNTITKSSYSTGSAQTSLSARRSSNFCLVGSHKITLASLGSSKFPLDKMKFEGKIRKLLGDEFQEKVPFLSPLEGNIYLKLASESHSNIRHQGFLTMFELISGFGVWNRRFFVLEGCNMYYWNHPNDRETKEAEGSISLSMFPSQCVGPVKRESCARPFTFELVNKAVQQEDQNQEPLSKCWFSADTKQERLDWMDKLNQALLDFHTWNQAQPEPQPSNPSISETLRESIL